MLYFFFKSLSCCCSEWQKSSRDILERLSNVQRKEILYVSTFTEGEAAVCALIDPKILARERCLKGCHWKTSLRWGWQSGNRSVGKQCISRMNFLFLSGIIFSIEILSQVSYSLTIWKRTLKERAFGKPWHYHKS